MPMFFSGLDSQRSVIQTHHKLQFCRDKTCNKNEESAVPALALEHATLSGFYLTRRMGGTQKTMQGTSSKCVVTKGRMTLTHDSMYTVYIYTCYIYYLFDCHN